ncbi:tyrosine-type recombinase/integrase [Clostridium perfringens]|nr:tyrosine-type recombinase/integrase [Clostridium perfringens]
MIHIKVQEINTSKGLRYILLDDEYMVVDEVKRFLKFLDTNGKSPNTLKNYAYHLKTYYEYMNKNNIPIKDLCNNKDKGPIDILSGFMLYLQYPSIADKIISINGEQAVRSDATVNIIMDTVLSFYQYLSKNNELEELDIYKNQRSNTKFKSFLHELVSNKTEMSKSIFKKKIITKEFEYITRKQFNELFFACNTERDRLLLALLYEGGLRINEALGMHLEDISQLEDNIIHIVSRENNENGARVKNHAEGIIKVPNYIVDMILDYINNDILQYDSNFLFLNLRGPNKGSPLKVGSVEDLFKRLSKKVGYKVHPHMLRHGFATEKLELGWSLEDISMYLRHKNIQSTQIYAHYSDMLKTEKIRTFLDVNKLEYGGVVIDSKL